MRTLLLLSLLWLLSVVGTADAQPPILYRETVREYAAPPPPPVRVAPVVRYVPVVAPILVEPAPVYVLPRRAVYAAPVYAVPAGEVTVRYGLFGRVRSVTYR